MKNKKTTAVTMLSIVASLGLVLTTAVPASAAYVSSRTCSKSQVLFLQSDYGAHSYRDHSITGNRPDGSYSNWDTSWGKTTVRAKRTSVSSAYKGAGNTYSSGAHYGSNSGCTQ